MAGRVNNDNLKAALLDGVDMTVGTLWSSFIPPSASPSDTLTDTISPAFTPPDIVHKAVAFPGDSPAGADYVILDRLGEGGMGIVFDAEQVHLRRRVALKMIKADKAADPLARNSFFYEAVVTAGLEHPGIVPVLDLCISQDGRAFYVMKKATGTPWSRVIREKTREENLEILEQVANVIAYVHAQQVIHRDLKPGNVLLGEFGEIWLGDWGVALYRNTAGDYSHAHPGGTPQYMAPEMARCESSSIGPACDIYLLGAILYEIITGRPPHAGDGVVTALENAASNTIRNDDLDDSLLPVALKAMATKPEQRYATVQEFQQAIRQAIRQDDSDTLLQRADAQLAEAKRRGGYEQYQLAIADYDAALEANPGNTMAGKRRHAAILAYAVQASTNGEYDLALSIVSPEVKNSKRAAELSKTIRRDQATAARKRRRSVIANTLLGVLVLGLILIGTYVYFNQGAIITDIVRSNGPTEVRYYTDVKREMDTLGSRIAEAVHVSHTKNFHELRAEMQKLADIWTECNKAFVKPEQATPARIKHALETLHAHLSEMEKYIAQERPDIETYPKSLQRALGEMKTLFAKLVVYVNSYRGSRYYIP